MLCLTSQMASISQDCIANPYRDNSMMLACSRVTLPKQRAGLGWIGKNANLLTRDLTGRMRAVALDV